MFLGDNDKLCEFYFPNKEKLNFWQSYPLFDERKWHVSISNFHYAITFPTNLLYTSGSRKKVITPQSDIKSWFSSQPPESFTETLNILMPSFMEQEIIKITDIADLIGISERTLRRRLANSGTNYNKMLEQNRLAIAKEKLINSNDSIIEIAQDLGYQYPEHFSRAFKRWIGISPRIFRQKLSSCQESDKYWHSPTVN